MNSKEQSQQELDNIFSGLEKNISRAFRENENYNEELEKNIMKLSNSISNRKVKRSLREDHPLLAHYDAVRGKMEKDCEAWLNNLAQSQKNKIFRNKFNESMLVYVYGKVKSGKSSLGNFIAYGKHNPTQKDIESQAHIEFDVEELSDADEETRVKLDKQKKKMRAERKFLVNFFEATASIQYFKKPGFTWIDSPGIHSTTKKNGKLAGEYLESADLVIYAMVGRSPARESDREEIKEIIKSGKKLLLVVTRCDETEVDEDEKSGELINVLRMYSAEDLADVKNESIKEILDSLKEIAPSPDEEELQKNTVMLSVKYAEEHPEEAAWGESGMAAFYQILGEIAKSDGVRLKLEAPIQAALDHISQIQEDMAQLQTELNDISLQVEKSVSELEHHSQMIAMNDGRDLAYKIANLAKTHKGDDKSFREQVLLVSEEALEKASDKLARIIAQNALNLSSSLQNKDLDITSLPSFQDIYQTISYHTTTNKRRGSLFGALVGGAVGFMVGGPAGAAIGAGIGSSGGSAIGTAMDGKRSEKVKVGDNSLDVGQEAGQKAREWLKEALANMTGGIKDQCLNPLTQWLLQTQAEFKEFEIYLLNKKQRLEKELVHGA